VQEPQLTPEEKAK
jgi:hypothetical protein